MKLIALSPFFHVAAKDILSVGAYKGNKLEVEYGSNDDYWKMEYDTEKEADAEYKRILKEWSDA